MLPASGWIWPYPRNLKVTGDELPLTKDFTFVLNAGLSTTAPAVQRLLRGVARYVGYLRPQNGTSVGLTKCAVTLDSTDDNLGLETLVIMHSAFQRLHALIPFISHKCPISDF